MSSVIKLVIVGGDGIGKTSLLTVFATNKFPDGYIPSIFDGWASRYEVDDGRDCTLQLWDIYSTSYHEYNFSGRLRALSYPQTDVFLMCYSIADILSYESITDEWYPEVSHYCPNVPILLVGTKLDLREDQEFAESHKNSLLSIQEGLKLQLECKNIVKYMECSALTQYGVADVFNEAVKLGLDYQKDKQQTRQSWKCSIS